MSTRLICSHISAHKDINADKEENKAIKNNKTGILLIIGLTFIW